MYQADKCGNLNKVDLQEENGVYHIEKSINFRDKKYVITQISLTDDEKYGFIITIFEDELVMRR